MDKPVCLLCNYQHGHAIGCKNNPVDIALNKMAQREWVGLTIEEKHHLNDILNLQGRFNVIDAIEAKLKEKNT